MYFESSKKTYYRFPSSSSIQEMDYKYYFPDKAYASGENVRMQANAEQLDYEKSDNFLVTK